MERAIGSRPRPHAQAIGVVYLLYFAAVIAGQVFIGPIAASGDAATTANHILAHHTSFRWGIGLGLLATAMYVGLTGLLYGLFKPVSQRVALSATCFSLVGCAVQASGVVFQMAPLALLDGSPYLTPLKGEQLRALALLSLNLNAQTSYVCLVFFGVFDFLIGCLIVWSTFLPRILGVLMASAGIGWVTCLSPPFAHVLSPYIEILGFLAEALLLTWLLVKGVEVHRWQEQASTRDGSAL